MIQFLTWLHNLMTRGLGYVAHRYYSIYRGVVTDNRDPDNLGRVKILCAQVGQTAAPDRWVMPAFAGAGNKRGMFFVPEKDDTVWVSFYEGDPNVPEVYWGGWFGEVDGATPDVPSNIAPKNGGYPEKKGFTTRAGHSLIFNDEAGKESITILWNQPKSSDPAVTDRTKTAEFNPDKSSILSFDPKGNFFVKTPSSYVFQVDDANKQIKLISPNGSMFTISEDDSVNLIHKSGSSISMNSSSIDISANVGALQNVNISGQNVVLNGGGVLLGGSAADFAVLGLRLITWLAAHTHGTGVGPSSPPITPPTPADFLSATVKVQQ